MGSLKYDYNKWTIAFTVITLRGFHCFNLDLHAMLSQNIFTLLRRDVIHKRPLK